MLSNIINVDLNGQRKDKLMKKVLSLILVFALALGLGFGVSFVQKDISAADINPTPEQGATVNLLEGDPLDFATHYSKGAINKYYEKGVDKYAPAPLVIEWEGVPGAKSYAVKLSEDETMKDAKDIDYLYVLEGVSRYRINYAKDLNGGKFTFRSIPFNIKSIK